MKILYLDPLLEVVSPFEHTHTHTHTHTEFQGQLTYQTTQDNTKLFNRTFSTDQYMYCKSCMPFLFTECSPDNLTCQPCVTTYDPKENKNGTICSRVDITEMILFPGDFEKRNPTSEFHCVCKSLVCMLYNY